MPNFFQSRSFFYGWVIVAVAFCVSFLSFGLMTYVRGIYVPLYAEAFAVGRYDITLAFVGEGLVAGLGAPVLGWFLDRGSPKRVLLFGLTLAVTGYVLLGLMSSLVQFYLIMAICFGIGMSCLGAFTLQRITISWFLARRGFALALVVLGASMSGWVMPLICVWLNETIGWRAALMVIGAVMAVILYPLIIALMKDDPADVGLSVDGQPATEPATAASEAAPDERIWRHAEILRSVAFWNIVLIFGVMMCVFTAVTVHAFGHMQDIGLSSYAAATAITAMTVCAAAGKPALGWITDHVGVRTSIWASLAFLAAGLWLLANASSALTATIAMGSFGLGYAGMLPLRAYGISATVGRRSFGTGNGLYLLAILPLSLGASPLAGRIYDLTGSYVLAFQLLIGLVAVAAIGPAFLPRSPVATAVPPRRDESGSR